MHTWSFLFVRTHGGGWAHQQPVSTTFLTQKNSYTFFLCSGRVSNLGSSNFESDTLYQLCHPVTPWKKDIWTDCFPWTRNHVHCYCICINANNFKIKKYSNLQVQHFTRNRIQHNTGHILFSRHSNHTHSSGLLMKLIHVHIYLWIRLGSGHDILMWSGSWLQVMSETHNDIYHYNLLS